MSIRRTSSIVLAAAVIALALGQPDPAGAQPAKQPASTYWLDIGLKARSMLVDPAEPGVLHEVMDQAMPMGVLSPDGKHVAFVGSDPQRVKEGHDFDLFVADVDPAEISGKANIRRVTTDQTQPTSPHWMIDGSGLAFLAGDSNSAQAWWIDLGPQSRPVMLSDGQHRCSDLAVLADGRIAWIVHTGSKNKRQFNDLILHPSPLVSGKRRTFIPGKHITAFAFSPDGRTLAWCEPATLHLVDIESGSSREIPLHGVHPQLINHLAHDLAWSPDSRLLAATFGFAGGISRGLNDDPNAPWPRMFAEDKVFFIPAEWVPSPESLVVGEGAKFPSPFVNDEKAEVSPPPGDQSKPWWVRELPMMPIQMQWISAADAKARIARPN